MPQRKRVRLNDSDGANELQILHFFSVLPQGQFSQCHAIADSITALLEKLSD